MIKKIKGQYVVMSDPPPQKLRTGKRKTGRVFGRYKTKEEAEKRLRQIEFFKHLAKSKSSAGSPQRKRISKK